MVFELTVNGKTFLINEANILYVQFGDQAFSVDICMLDQKHITITNGTNAEAQEMYNKIRTRLIADMNLTNL